MIRSYRIWRNMDKKYTDAGDHVNVQLFTLSLPMWIVSEAAAATEECCGLLHHLPLPKWLVNWEAKWGCDCLPANTAPLYDDGCACWSKFGDYYGDSWGSLWHLYIESPLTNLVYKHTKPGIDVNASLDQFPEDFADVAWIRSEIEREKKYTQEHGGIVNPLDLPCVDYGGQTWFYKLVEWATRPWRTELCDGTGPENKLGISG